MGMQMIKTFEEAFQFVIDHKDCTVFGSRCTWTWSTNTRSMHCTSQLKTDEQIVECGACGRHLREAGLLVS